MSYLTDVTDRKAGNMTWYQVNPFTEMSTKEFPDEGLHQLLSLARSSRHPLLVFALAFLSEKGDYTIPFVNNSKNVPPYFIANFAGRLVTEGGLPDLVKICDEDKNRRTVHEATKAIANLAGDSKSYFFIF